MAPLTLKQLRYAIALAETGHFGDAAAQCHVTQPALSQQIRAIEEMSGAPLFDRLARRVAPTPFGRDFLDRARAVLAQADALDAFVARRGGHPDRPLRFGLIPTVAPYLLPEIFPELTRALPVTRFTISENKTEPLLAGLADGSLDLALIATEPPPGRPRLTVLALFADRFVLAAPATETPVEPVALDELERDRVLLLDEGHCFRDQAIAACGLDAKGAARTFAATSLTTIVEFVANGQGVTLLPEIALRKEAGDRRIGIHPLAAPGAGRILSLVWRADSPYADLYRTIAGVIRNAGGSGAGTEASWKPPGWSSGLPQIPATEC